MKLKKILLTTLMCGAVVLGGENFVAENFSVAQAAEISAERNTPVVRVAKAVGPAVVGITNKAVVNEQYFDFFRGGFFNVPHEVEGVGSGVIFRKDGYIVTNNHVVADAKELVVSFSDGKTLTAELVGADEMTDIAVVKVKANDLPFAKFGNSDEIMVGEPAIAIGNPLGLEFQGSVTVGVVSALNRKLSVNEGFVRLIQTDAAINPGNSGGALLNYDGEVIGINSAKLATTAVEGMGFAIPINTVQEIISELMEKGRVVRPALGIQIMDNQTAAQGGYKLNLKKGVYVYRVQLGSSAHKAGLLPDDVILSVDGEEVNSVTELRNKIMTKKIGDKVRIRYSRDGKEDTVTIILQELSDQRK